MRFMLTRIIWIIARMVISGNVTRRLFRGAKVFMLKLFVQLVIALLSNNLIRFKTITIYLAFSFSSLSLSLFVMHYTRREFEMRIPDKTHRVSRTD